MLSEVYFYGEQKWCQCFSLANRGSCWTAIERPSSFPSPPLLPQFSYFFWRIQFALWAVFLHRVMSPPPSPVRWEGGGGKRQEWTGLLLFFLILILLFVFYFLFFWTKTCCLGICRQFLGLNIFWLYDREGGHLLYGWHWEGGGGFDMWRRDFFIIFSLFSLLLGRV